MTDNKDELLKAVKFAALANVSTTTVYGWINTNKIKFVERKRGSMPVRFIPRSELSKVKELINK